MFMNKVLIVGCGHMGTALINSWLELKTYSFTVVDPYNYKEIKNVLRSKKVDILGQVPTQKQMLTFDLILFAVKPQVAGKVLAEYENFKLKKNVIISSIIAGKKLIFLKKE